MHAPNDDADRRRSTSIPSRWNVLLGQQNCWDSLHRELYVQHRHPACGYSIRLLSSAPPEVQEHVAVAVMPLSVLYTQRPVG